MSVADAGLSRFVTANEHPPAIRIRYFYASQLALDDPLSPVPAPATATASNRLPPRPLSDIDSDAIDKAWNDLRAKIKSYREGLERKSKPKFKDITPQTSPKLQPHSTSRTNSISRDRSASKRSSRVLDEVRRDTSGKASPGSNRRSTISSLDGRHVAHADDQELSNSPQTRGLVETSFDIGESNQGTTGTPFVRAPIRSKVSASFRSGIGPIVTESETSDSRRSSIVKPASGAFDSLREASTRLSPPSTSIPVGVARLHQVVLPNLQYDAYPTHLKASLLTEIDYSQFIGHP